MSKPTCEETLQIDLAEPAIRRVIDMRGAAHGEITWASAGQEIAAVVYEWNSAGACLTLSWTAGGIRERQVIRTARSRPYFGGARLWLYCPITRRNVRAVFLPVGSSVWASRAAHSLPYSSQRVNGKARKFKLLLSQHGRTQRRAKMRQLLRRTSQAR
jgi:hypothetical protein